MSIKEVANGHYALEKIIDFFAGHHYWLPKLIPRRVAVYEASLDLNA